MNVFLPPLSTGINIPPGLSSDNFLLDYRRLEEELNGRLVFEYFDGQRKRLKTGSLSLPITRRVLQDRSELSSKDDIDQIYEVDVTGESVFEVIKEVLYCFLSTYS
jgi:hypothetical protein